MNILALHKQKKGAFKACRAYRGKLVWARGYENEPQAFFYQLDIIGGNCKLQW